MTTLTDTPIFRKQSALSSSFHPPPAAPTARPEPAIDQVLTPSTDLETAPEELEDWKPEYEARLARWQAEATEAREKAEKTRKRIEDERAAELKRVKDQENSVKKEKADREKKEKDDERLRFELGGGKVQGSGLGIGGVGREGKVREAWEMIGSSATGGEVVTDGRGLTKGDVSSSSKAPIKEVSAFSGVPYLILSFSFPIFVLSFSVHPKNS